MKGTIREINGKYAITYLKSKGLYGIIKYMKTYFIIPEQQEKAKILDDKEVEFKLQNNLAILNI